MQKFITNGSILFDGKSNIDGQEIVVILTGLDNKTSNKKPDVNNLFKTMIDILDNSGEELLADNMQIICYSFHF